MIEVTQTKKRADLHLHTICSRMDSLIRPKQLIEKAEEMGLSAIAITDTGAVHSFPEMLKSARGKDIKLIFGIDAYFKNDVDKNITSETDLPLRITMLAKNQVGLKNIYKMLSAAYLRSADTYPVILKSEILEHREGVLLGTGGVEGEVFLSVYFGKEINGLIGFYDYVEILPCYGGSHGLTAQMEQFKIEEVYRNLVELAKANEKPFIISSDARFIEPEDEEAWRVLRDEDGETLPEYESLPFYLKNPEVLQEEFAYLGEENCSCALIDNPMMLANACETVSLFPELDQYPPCVDGADDKLRYYIHAKAKELYGASYPDTVRTRLDEEMRLIYAQRAEGVFLAAMELVEESKKAGYPVGTRGAVGSSFVAFLLGITGINPLPPHYRCDCGYIEFIRGHLRGCGIDLPDRACPKCGKPLFRDGYNIPYEAFLGESQFRLVEIYLDFSSAFIRRAERYLRDTFGDDHVLCTGNVTTLPEVKAKGMVARYAQFHKKRYSDNEQARIVEQITGVMTAMGMFPGGWIIIPQSMATEDFCPAQRISYSKDHYKAITHFDYYAMEVYLQKLELLSHIDIDILSELFQRTGVEIDDIPMGEEKTMELFCSTKSLEVNVADDVLCNVGTDGVRAFADSRSQRVLSMTQPKDYDCLIRAFGLAHGYHTWSGNAERLIADGTADIGSVIGTREDIFFDLYEWGLRKKTAFAIMMRVRKGMAHRAGFNGTMAREMEFNEIPIWYVKSMEKIGYLFPKSHGVAFALTAYRIAWFKLHYPLEFYSTLFRHYLKKGLFDSITASRGLDAVRERIISIESNQASAEDTHTDGFQKREMYRTVYEFLRRGYVFLPEDNLSGTSFAIEKGVGLHITRNIDQ